ncbi:MAG: hypothetical protein NXH75_13255, partial [Halobacteriovoraceae bacterium]|nr:hypothetical protein [Halobacteriovoraceae bacterium]
MKNTISLLLIMMPLSLWAQISATIYSPIENINLTNRKKLEVSFRITRELRETDRFVIFRS